MLWIISIYAANLTLRLYLSNDTPENIRRSDYADIGALVADIGAAALAIYVVRQVTRRQAERNRRMQDAPRPLPAPLVTAAPPA